MSFLQSLNDAGERFFTRARLRWLRGTRYPPITRLHLLYHIAPLAANDVWRVNLALLRPHLAKFDRLVVGVVEGDGMVPVASVQQELAGHPVEWVVRANDARLGEVVTFPEMLARVASTEPGDASLYGHSKGVSRPDNAAVALWRDALYRTCLDDVEGVKAVLRRFACAGPFMKRGPQDAWDAVAPDHFHYAGAFFWFRHDRLFTRPNWRDVRPYRFGVEEYLGRVIEARDAACLYGDYAGSLYDLGEWDKVRSCLRSVGRVIGHAVKGSLMRRPAVPSSGV